MTEEINQVLTELLYNLIFSNQEKSFILRTIKALQIPEQLKLDAEKLFSQLPLYTNNYDKIKLLEEKYPYFFNLLKNKSEIKIYTILSRTKIKVYRKNLEMFLIDENIPFSVRLNPKGLNMEKLNLIAKFYDLPNLDENEVKIFNELLKEKIKNGLIEHSIFENDKQELMFIMFINLLMKANEIVRITSQKDLEDLITRGVFLEKYIFLHDNLVLVPISLIKSNNINLQILYYALHYQKLKRETRIFELTETIGNKLKIKRKIIVWCFDVNELKEKYKLIFKEITKEELVKKEEAMLGIEKDEQDLSSRQE